MAHISTHLLPRIRYPEGSQPCEFSAAPSPAHQHPIAEYRHHREGVLEPQQYVSVDPRACLLLTRFSYIFQELVTGGDLFSYLEYKGGCLCDTEAAVIVRQILKGIDYLHDRDIVHRDLKPDNVLMTSLDEGARVVITDFGNARWLPQPDKPEERWSPLKRRMFSEVGTLEYTAP